MERETDPSRRQQDIGNLLNVVRRNSVALLVSHLVVSGYHEERPLSDGPRVHFHGNTQNGAFVNLKFVRKAGVIDGCFLFPSIGFP